LNQGKVAVFDELCAPDFIFHDPDRPDVTTLEDFKRMLTEGRSACPDFHLTIDDLIATDEKVVLRWTWRGTNTGDIVAPTMRIPATGRQVAVTGISIIRFAEKKEVEHWHLEDNVGLFVQLGLIPVPQPAA
jgi:steroid delta-isomerase-like uncharacterized protein